MDKNEIVCADEAHCNKEEIATMFHKALYRVAVGTVIGVCAVSALGEEWMPGTPNKDYPHVVAGEIPDKWVPAPGWKFANDEPGDLSVEPLPANEARVAATNGELRIPPPTGFWTPEPGSLAEKAIAAEVAAAQGNNCYFGCWVKWTSPDGSGYEQAGVYTVQPFKGKTLSLDLFAKVCKETKKQLAANGEEMMSEVLAKTADAVSGFSASLGAKGLSSDVSRILPPHLEERDRMAFTSIRKDRIELADGLETVSYSVNSIAMSWIKGSLLYFAMARNVGEETALDEAVKSSRQDLSKWLSEVDAANNRLYLDDENKMVYALPDCLDNQIAQENKRTSTSSGSSILRKVLVWAVIGGLWGLVSSLFKKNKNNG